VRIGKGTTVPGTAHTPIRIAMATERTSRIAMAVTHHPGMDTRTNRGLGPDHPRIRTLRRGGRAETSAWMSNGRADIEAKVRARAWNETSPAVKWGWLNLAEAYGRLASL
jgi:hypothetical protein